MNAAALSARMHRLEQLSLGIARETQLVGESDIFLYRERRDYLDALHRTHAGLESARVASAKAWRRLDGNRRRGPTDYNRSNSSS
jgi:hypothetical protein